MTGTNIFIDPDWADEITNELHSKWADEEGVPLFRISACIRKVKIETLREAAHMTRPQCYVLADKLEKGES